MASLKEVKGRIITVNSIRKITQARQMVASAQLHRAQNVLEKAQAYKLSLEEVVSKLASSCGDIKNPFIDKRDEGGVIVVVMGGNEGMSGAFNTNMIRKMQSIPNLYPDEKVTIIPVGKKIRAALEQSGIKTDTDYDYIMGKIAFKNSMDLSSRLIELFCKKEAKKIDIIYYHFKNIAMQEMEVRTFLPFGIPIKKDEKTNCYLDEYILEPSQEELLINITPMYLHAIFYEILADNQTSEFGASTMAMELATDNADKILEELQLSYNKLRQQNITSELLDIIGESFK